MKELTAKDLMTKDYAKLLESEPVSLAISKFKDDEPIILVVDEKNHLKGTLTKTQVIESTVNPEKSRVNSLMGSKHNVQEDDSALKAVNIMRENHLRGVPVTDKDERVIGVIRDEEVLREIQKRELSKERLAHVMTSSLTTVDPSTTVVKARQVLRENNLERLPVMEGGKLQGIVTLQDLLHFKGPQSSMNLGERVGEKIPTKDNPVSGVMTDLVVQIDSSKTVGDAVTKMLSKNVSDLIVIDEGRVTGMITKNDIFKKALEEPREVEKLFGPYSLQIIDKTGELSQYERGLIDEELRAFADKHLNKFKQTVFHVHLEEQKESFRRQALNTLRLKLLTDRGDFFAEQEEWSPDHSLREALEAVKKQVDEKIGRLERK